MRLAVLLLAESGGEQIRQEAYTSDLSRHGVRLEADITLATGQLVEIIPHDAPGPPMFGRVVWSGEPKSDRPGEMGLEFLQPPSVLA